MTDALQLKERIMALVQSHGPTLPTFIASQTGLSIIFSSAFLSELIADKRLKISHMRVGSSPLYFIPGQEPLLENYSHYLKNKEKDAFILLKEKRFLKDRELEPAIRVALRMIRDFAVPFKRNDEIYWRYFLVGELEFQDSPREEMKIKEEPKIIEIIEVKENHSAEEIAEEKQEERTEESEKKKETREPREAKEIKVTKKQPKKKAEPKKKNPAKEKKNNFFSKVKEFLSQRQIEILEIEEIGISKIVFRVKKEEEYLIIAYNKKKISENDIINSSKKAEEMNLPYQILLLGEPLKRLDNLVKAVKNLRNIEKVE